MADLAVQFSAVRGGAQQLASYQKQLQSINSTVRAVQRGLSASLGAAARLQAVSSRLEKHAAGMAALGTGLENAVGAYTTTEARLSGRRAASGPHFKDAPGKQRAWYFDMAGSVLGKFGLLGNVFSTVTDWRRSDWMKNTSNLLKVTGDVAKLQGKASAGWAEALGVDKVPEGGLSNAFDKFKWKPDGTSADKLGTVAAWGSAIFTAGSKAKKLAEQEGRGYGDATVYLEAGVATATDIAISSVLKVTVGAAVSTAVVGLGAPVWAAAAAGVVVVGGLKWAGDALVKATTGYSSIGDLVGAGAVKVAETGAKAAKAVADTAKNVTQAAVKGIANAGKAFAKWVKIV